MFSLYPYIFGYGLYDSLVIGSQIFQPPLIMVFHIIRYELLAVDLPVFLVVHFREHVVFILNLYAKLCKDEVPRFFIGYELVDGE